MLEVILYQFFSFNLSLWCCLSSPAVNPAYLDHSTQVTKCALADDLICFQSPGERILKQITSVIVDLFKIQESVSHFAFRFWREKSLKTQFVIFKSSAIRDTHLDDPGSLNSWLTWQKISCSRLLFLSAVDWLSTKAISPSRSCIAGVEEIIVVLVIKVLLINL